MICDEVRRMLGAYVDKELELTRQPDLEKHLAGCPPCQAAAEEMKNFSSLILMNIPVYKAPGELRVKIQASLRRESRPKLEWFSRVILPLAYAREGIVLLKNESHIFPLDRNKICSIGQSSTRNPRSG
jgi:anti-sigma factor RsiW